MFFFLNEITYLYFGKFEYKLMFSAAFCIICNFTKFGLKYFVGEIKPNIHLHITLTFISLIQTENNVMK